VNAREQTSAASGDRSLDLRLPATPRVAFLVRRALAYLDLPQPILEDAQLLASELVTNSIRHAGLDATDEVRIRATRSGSKLRIDIYDRSSAELNPLAGSIRPAPGSVSGWGLYLVDHMANRWGTTPGRYWFELELLPDHRDS
jgi:anti-sigma regulatory factor (Ser/Thr protein kinase)